MKDREIDEILREAGQVPHAVDTALLEGVVRSIEPTLRPVRPLPPAWALAGGLIGIGAAVAVAGAARAGFYGVHKLSGLERAVIFPALGLLLWLAATAYISEMTPGSRRRAAPGVLLGAGSLALAVVFAVLFHDYQTHHFVSRGVVCLTAGLLHAIPAAAVSWLLLRRGFAVDSVGAGLAAGALAGLAGVTMLELHCPNFEALHVILWHTAVLPVSGAAGALLAWAAHRSRVG